MGVNFVWFRHKKRFFACGHFLPFPGRFYSASRKADLGDAYKPGVVESEERECCDYFRPKARSSQTFSMILPPPNITGSLHLGHALTATVQDVIVRWKRMEGVDCVWVPGIDHAGIATQVVVEKLLWGEKGQSRHDLGRERFQARVWNWKEEKEAVIESQLRRLGACLDWSRKVFTMDPKQSQAVAQAFIKLFESGLIYRADHLVNWSCSLQSAISDIEVDHLEVIKATKIAVPNCDKAVEFGTLTRFAYKVCDSDEDEVVVATTRPETMLGDVAVAVNPRDGRYSRFVGRFLWHPFRKVKIPVICDDFVDPEFGTGAVKVTPAHDPVDFEVGKRHSLALLQVIDEKGNLTRICGEFAGIGRFAAREVILSRLEKLQLLRGREDHKMLVPICSRSKDIVEHLVKPQWFIKCAEMAKEAVEDVESGRLTIEPKHFEKVWFDWLGNIRDWCISRQLWWGHRIPAFSCRPQDGSAPAIWVPAMDQNSALRKASAHFSCPQLEIQQDEDVLDTWFSSALLPFSVWRSQQESPNYPLDLMETGHDILFFWVARMVMLGKQLTGRLPFERVLLHGIIRDAHGRKMSKSLGNVILPEEVICGTTSEKLEEGSRLSHEAGILSKEELTKALEGQKKMFPSGIPECGADALRFTLCSHNIKSHFIDFDVQECHTNRLFCNKIWQATKFTNNAVETAREWLGPIDTHQLGLMDRWILSKLSGMVDVCRQGMHNHDFHQVTAAIKEFLYFQFCDVYLETTKRAFKLSERGNAAGHCWTLTHCLDTALRALAPFMPRLAQHLHQRLETYPGTERNFYYPKDLNLRDVKLEEDVSKVMEVVVGIRRLKKLFGVAAKHKPEVYLLGDGSFFAPFLPVMEALSICPLVTLAPPPKDTVCDRVGDTHIHLVVPPELRKAFELDLPKLEDKKTKLVKELAKMNKMLSGENYKLKATPEAQKSHAKKIAVLEEKLARINHIQSLSKS
ncbi:valine--tRNA ligase [Tribolium castaneum]|uniref:valine--tRNA ligase n=1 Tax=Tribolium castaneum TaxID=7070 RepID=D6WEJ1_TRICA|nr:PREDICTED: valine--tRNA ligase [Tribolium castaneum]EFA00421.1 Valine--tRNA ligase-like Protein [Tribolium castaneum]|eukprot:XP_008190571.1 PREDICTED: valine--tRNA ligase [Tribolium castaneum]